MDLAVGVAVGWVLLAALWGLLGVIALIWSLVCFGRSGSSADKVVGLVVALLLGPLFFLFYGFNSGYCR